MFACVVGIGLALGSANVAAEGSTDTMRLEAIPVTPGVLVLPKVLQTSSNHRQSALRYPDVALHQRTEGTVVVRAKIAADGTVERVWLKESSGYTSLDRAALAHVQARTFVPASRNGNAVALLTAIPVTFDLPDPRTGRGFR